MLLLLLSLAGLAAGAWVLVAATLYVKQRALLYLPDREPPDIATTGVLDARAVTLRTADGLALLAWYRPAPPGRPLIVYFHGNAGHVGYRADRFRRFADEGYGALFVEYRGYGGNPGSPTEDGLFDDARAALAFAAEAGLGADRLVLYGESLGSGVAVAMAAEQPVAALILESPYASIAAVAQRRYFYVPVTLLLKDHFDSLSRIGRVTAPFLVLQGAKDTLVPPSEGRQLIEAARAPAELWVAPEAAHNDMTEHGAVDAALAYLRRILPPR